MLETIPTRPVQTRVYRLATQCDATAFLREQELDPEGIDEMVDLRPPSAPSNHPTNCATRRSGRSTGCLSRAASRTALSRSSTARSNANPPESRPNIGSRTMPASQTPSAPHCTRASGATLPATPKIFAQSSPSGRNSRAPKTTNSATHWAPKRSRNSLTPCWHRPCGVLREQTWPCLQDGPSATLASTSTWQLPTTPTPGQYPRA